MNILARHNVTIRGEGSPLFLFAHGFGCDQNMWRHVAGAFAQLGTVVLFDHMGAGQSDLSQYRAEAYEGLEGYAADVIAICEALGRDDVVFVGHSVSATIGVLAAVARPELFRSLVLVGASPRYANAPDYHGGFGEQDIGELLDLLDKNQLDWSALMAPTVMGASNDPAHALEWRDSVCRTDPRVARQFATATFKSDHRADYARVSTSTLLIECAEDALAPPQVGEFVHQAISGSSRVVLSAAGHCPHMTHPDEVIRAIADFTASPTRAAA